MEGNGLGRWRGAVRYESGAVRAGLPRLSTWTQSFGPSAPSNAFYLLRAMFCRPLKIPRGKTFGWIPRGGLTVLMVIIAGRCGGGCGAVLAAAESLSYNLDIRPILSENCWGCHGPDQAKRKGGWRLDERDGATRPAKSGNVPIVPGNAAASELMLRVLATAEDEQMPPPDSGHRLTAAQKAVLRRWIEAGATYERHWALEPIRQAPVDTAGIDLMVGQYLPRAGLLAARPAAPEMQLRRVSLDLTGVPPTPAEVHDFIKEVTTRGLAAAYETAVDRLFRSSRYGERMAWPWLEAARYADTDGYQNDGPREMWRWRDWVISAFNTNMPFDQFTIEQLAGDLLPQPTHEQLIATGFNRNNRYNSEEGIPIDEFLLENAVDRVDTTATVWMGLTAGCARCHDHKYDPLTQKEYYQLVDYFNDVAESGRAKREGNSEPWIKTPTIKQRAQAEQLAEKVAQARAALASGEPAIRAAQVAWEAGLVEPGPALKDGLDFYFSFDRPDPQLTAKAAGAELHPGVQGMAATLADKSYFELIKIPGLIGNGRFSVAFWMKPAQVDQGPVLSSEEAGTGRGGILVEMMQGRLRWNINTRWISGVSTVETQRRFNLGEWVHITLTNDGTQRAAGMKMYVNGAEVAVDIIRNTNSNAAPRPAATPVRIGYSKHVGYWQGQIDELRFYPTRTLALEEAGLLAVRATVAMIVARSEAERTPAEQRLIRLTFLEQGAAPEQAALLKAVQQAEKAWLVYDDRLPTTMIMRDLPEGRPSFVRVRGVYDALGERVVAGVPAAFPPLASGEKNDRLAFARWLVSPAHPLTARVTVNRYWQLLFGRGFVGTTEDFGSQGEMPSHPELLDGLAAGFVASGWYTKALLRRIVLSATYRQSSVLTADHRQRDPDNRWLARAPRLRLSGNALRDQALFVAGLLNETLGGPSVFPYQPAGLWEEASNAKYTLGQGADLYRRSLYTYWKRTLAPPSMALLDAGDREYCSVKPKHTNTPLQALTLLNETTFVEAARKLAERMLSEGGTSDEARIAFGFEIVATRRPTAAESRLLLGALGDYRREFQADPVAVAASLKVGSSAVKKNLPPLEVAAMAALANVLLNLDEVTTRE